MSGMGEYRRATFVLPCCCLGVLGLAFIIWLSIMTHDVHELREDLDHLVRNCKGVCTATGFGVASAGNGHHSFKSHSADAGMSVFTGKVAKNPIVAADAAHKKSSTPKVGGDGAAAAADVAAPRWSRAGAEKKPAATKQ
jgi:hypothetical protein